MEFHGHVASVVEVILGSETTSDLLAAATVIPIAETADFAEGLDVLIDGEVYTVTSVDDGDDTGEPSITLAAGLVADIAAETRVDVWNDSTERAVAQWWATVTDDLDSSSMQAPLTHSLIALFSADIRGLVGESVVVTQDGAEEWWVTEVIGAHPNLDLNYADPTTIPDQTPTEAPPSSPTLTATGLSDSILLRTTPVHATTGLTFQVLVDAVWTDLNATPIGSTLFVVRNLPTGEVLTEGVTYSFRVVASNIIGSAAPSAPVDAALDTSVTALVASRLITEQVIAGFALLGSVHIGGDVFTLDPVGVNPENPRGGMRIQLGDGGLIHLPADGSPAVFSGDVVARYLETVDGGRLGGEVGVFGSVTMAASDIPNPTVAPTVQSFYSDTPLPVSAPVGIALGLGGADWATVVGGILTAFTSGAVTDEATEAVPNVVGVTSVGGSYYMLRYRAAGFTVREYGSGLNFVESTVLPGTASRNGSRATIGNDGTNVVVAYELHDGDAWSGDVVMTRYNPADWSVVSTVTVDSPGDVLGGVSYGDAGGDFAANRWVLHPCDGDVQVFNTSGVRQTGDEWTRPYGKPVRGLQGANTDFFVIDNAGVVRTLAGANDAPAATYHWSYAWVDADTHTTLCSPETEHERLKRSQVRVTFSTAPQEAAAGTHVANLIEPFVATTSGGTKHSQSALAVGTKAANYTDVDTSSGGAPGSNNWSGISPTGRIESETGGWWIDGNGDGDIGTGTFADSVAAAGGSIPARLGPVTYPAAEVTNFNSAIENGKYFASNTATNPPIAGQYWHLEVDSTTAGFVVQEAYIYVNGAPTTVGQYRYRRYCASGAWGSWFQVEDGVAFNDARYQPLDSDLTAIAALTTTSYGRAFLALANQAALVALLTNSLQALSGITGGANTVPYFTSSTAMTTATFTATGRSIVGAATTAAARSAVAAAALRRTVNAQTGTTYTLVIADEDSVVQVSNAGAHTLTVPPNASVAFAVGAEIEVARIGAGTVTIAPGAGVTINSRSGLLSINGQYGVVRLRKRASDTWLLSGDLV